VADLPTLDEDEHQALDLLESLEGVGELWGRLDGTMPAPAETPTPAASELFELANQAGIDPKELGPAHDRVLSLLARYVPACATNLLGALPPVIAALRQRSGDSKAVRLAAAAASNTDESTGTRELEWMDGTRREPLLALLQDDEEAGGLDDQAFAQHLRSRIEQLDAQVNQLGQRIQATPELAWAFAPAIAATNRGLAVPRDSLVDALLRHKSTAAPRDPLAQRVGAVVSRWLRAAYLKTVAGDEVSDDATAQELVRFRLDSSSGAAKEIRAQALAADLPDRIDIARKVTARADGNDAMELFTQAVEAAVQAERDERSPHRRFTWMHVALVVAVVALTVWHYYLR
jgi:hypothetical protein